MNCIFCQNYEISQLGKGKEVTIEDLADIMLKQQEKGVENINLVTPTSYALHIIEAIKQAKSKGLVIPIVYNTNGYENVETLKLLEGYIDIYLPDLKYYYNELGKSFSKVDNYFEIATSAIKEMYRQVGVPQLNKNGIMKKGLMIRHLILPNQTENSKQILKWIKENLDNNIYVSTEGDDDNGNGSQSNPYVSVSKAVEKYNSSVNSNIFIKNGNYSFTDTVILNKTINITGESSTGVILNGNHQNYLFKVNNKATVYLSNLTLMNGNSTDKSSSYSDYPAGAIYLSYANALNVDNCRFIDNCLIILLLLKLL